MVVHQRVLGGMRRPPRIIRTQVRDPPALCLILSPSSERKSPFDAVKSSTPLDAREASHSELLVLFRIQYFIFNFYICFPLMTADNLRNKYKQT